MKPLAAAFLITWAPQTPNEDIAYRVDPPGLVTTEARAVIDAEPGSTATITAFNPSGTFPDAPPATVTLPKASRVKLVIETWPGGEEVASVWVPADGKSGFWRMRVEKP